MFGINPFRRPQSSYQRPVPLVLVNPAEQADYQVCFNKEWLPYVLGSLRQLSLETTWRTDDPQELANQLGRANVLISQFMAGCISASEMQPLGGEMDEEMRIRVSPDDPCIIQHECTPGVWETFYNPRECITEIVNEQGAPSPGGEITEGQHFTACPVLQGSGMYQFPAAVLPGDTVTISGATGAWCMSSNPLDDWHCPSGDEMFLGACIEATGGAAGAGAPMPAENAMRLVVYYDGLYYDAYNTTIVIPDSAQNSQLLFHANDIDLADNQGSITFCVDVLHPVPVAEDFSGYDWAIVHDVENINQSYLWYINSANGNAPNGYVVGTGIQSGLGGNNVAAKIGLSLAGGGADLRRVTAEMETVFNEGNVGGGGHTGSLSFIVQSDDNITNQNESDSSVFAHSLTDIGAVSFADNAVQINPGFVTKLTVIANGLSPNSSETSNVKMTKLTFAGFGNLPALVHI